MNRLRAAVYAVAALCIVALAAANMLARSELKSMGAALDAAKTDAANARAAASIASATAIREADRAARASALSDELAAILEDRDVPLPPDLADFVNGAADRLRPGDTNGSRRP